MLEEIKTKKSEELTDKEKNKVRGSDACTIICDCGLCGDKLSNVNHNISRQPTIVP